MKGGLHMYNEQRLQHSLVGMHFTKKLKNYGGLVPVNFRDEEGRIIIPISYYLKEVGEFALGTKSVLRSVFANAMPSSLNFKGSICSLLGAGHTRDWGFVGDLVERGVILHCFEASKSGCNFANIRLKPYTPRYTIFETEIRNLNNLHCDTQFIYAGAFLPVLKSKVFVKVVKDMAAFLRKTENGLVVVTDPLLEDNTGLKEWNGNFYPVEWGDANPYSLQQVLLIMNQKAKRQRIAADVVAKVPYFHHTYSVITFKLEGNY